jgi:hypothetical protein
MPIVEKKWNVFLTAERDRHFYFLGTGCLRQNTDFRLLTADPRGQETAECFQAILQAFCPTKNFQTTLDAR